MTDIQGDVPVGRDDEAAETVSTHTEAPENGPVTAASEYPAAVSDAPASNECGEAPLTNDVEAEPALDTPTPVEPVMLADNPADTDPEGDGRTDAPGANEVSTQGDQAPASPPLREPDEAALRLAEAAVLASATPMTPRALSQILADDLDPAAVIAALRARYDGRGFELYEIGGGLQFRTAADLAPQLRKVVQVPRRLPRVALETLAIVAYHQPITRPEIEDLRGTGLSQQTLDVLLENDLIVARGRKETPGRPTLWGTTAKFLEYFGLRDIRELPRRQDLLLEAVRPETAADADPVPAAETDPVPPEGAESGPEATQPA
jgi:segregation and condensation protein B